MVAQEQIENLTGRPVTQIGSKQLFIVEYENYNLVYSYWTIVGYITKENLLKDGLYTCTDRKYSVTTTRQLKSIKHKKIPESIFRVNLKWLTDTGTIPKFIEVK